MRAAIVLVLVASPALADDKDLATSLAKRVDVHACTMLVTGSEAGLRTEHRIPLREIYWTAVKGSALREPPFVEAICSKRGSYCIPGTAETRTTGTPHEIGREKAPRTTYRIHVDRDPTVVLSALRKLPALCKPLAPRTVSPPPPPPTRQPSPPSTHKGPQ